jgi:hypothetical protein
MYCDMFKVTSCKHVSTTVAEDFCYKVWIVEARSHGNTQTLLLGAVFPTPASWSQRYIEEIQNSSEEQKKDSRATSGAKDAVLSCNLCLYSVAIVTHHGCNLQ